jgi:hypothetical protein
MKPLIGSGFVVGLGLLVAPWVTAHAQQPAAPAPSAPEIVLPADVSAEDRQKIGDILNRSGFFPIPIPVPTPFPVPVPIPGPWNVRSATMPATPGASGSVNVDIRPFQGKSADVSLRDKFVCPIICDATAASAAALCTGSTVGAGLVACLAAAAGARDYCRSRC